MIVADSQGRLLGPAFAAILALSPPLPTMAADDPASQAPAAPAEDAGLSGSWILDEKASDDPLALMKAARSSDRGGLRPGAPAGMRSGGMGGGMGGPGGMGGGGMGGGGMGGGSQPFGDQSEVGGFRGRPQGGEGADMAPGVRLQQEIARLEIFQQGAEWSVTDGLDLSRSLQIGGQEASVWTDRGEVRARARWEGPVLVEEWLPAGRGPGRTCRYSLSEDGRRLTVRQQRSLPGEDEPLTFTLVYDRRP